MFESISENKIELSVNFENDKVCQISIDLNLFVVIAYQLPILGRYNHDFQATVHFSLTSAVDKSQQHRNKFLGIPRIEPWTRYYKENFSVHLRYAEI